MRAAVLAAQGMRVELALDVDLVRAAELLECPQPIPVPPKHPQEPGPTLSLGDAPTPAVFERIGAVVLIGDKYWGWMLDRRLLSHLIGRGPSENPLGSVLRCSRACRSTLLTRHGRL